MSTENNLKTAFAGELAFAKKADEEGHPGVAKLFRAAAEAETVHAMSELNVLGTVKSTAENLQAAIDGETEEFTNMYPGFIEEAQNEGNTKAKRSFEMANAAEKVHADLYKKALAALNQKSDVEYYVAMSMKAVPLRSVRYVVPRPGNLKMWDKQHGCR